MIKDIIIGTLIIIILALIWLKYYNDTNRRPKF